MSEPFEGLLVLDKPSGLTSFDCVARVRQLTGQDRVGHAGTLDPLATGVLLILLGSATRQQENAMKLEKQYRFKAQFGFVTETGDREGRCVHRYPPIELTSERLGAALKSFVGSQWQRPPRFSALKYKGKKYYDWALEGTEIPRSPRTIHIYSFELLSYQWPWWEARVVCSRGTYVRTLIEDLAEHVGTGACLENLIRERIGPYDRREAMSWEVLNSCGDSELRRHCLPAHDAKGGEHDILRSYARNV